MSSHHVVKDNQEPALVVLSPRSVSVDILHSLLEWSPMVIANEISYAWLSHLGIKVNTVFVNEDKSEYLELDPSTEVISVIEERLMVDIFDFLAKKNTHEASIIQKAEPAFFNILDNHSINTTVFDSGFKWFRIEGDFKKWIRAGCTFRSFHETMIRLNEHTETWTDSESCFAFTSKEEGFITMDSSESIWIGEEI